MKNGLRSLSSVGWLCLALLGCSGGSRSTEGEGRELLGTTSDHLVPSPIMGTLGYSATTDKLYETWDIGDNSWIGGWHLSLTDRLVKDRIADFDGDGYADVIVTSAWGMGILGTNAQNVWTFKAMSAYGTDIGGWVLSPDDRVAAVGVFANASPSNAAMMVLQRAAPPATGQDKGIAFVKIGTGSVLQAAYVRAINSTITGSNQSWTVRYGDRLFNVGKLKGSSSTDAIAAFSDQGMGVFLPSATVAPTLIARAQNGTSWSGSVTYTLSAEDPRLRAYGGDIDNATDTRNELLLTGPSGLAMLHMNNATDISGTSPWDLRFRLLDGDSFSGTSVKGTLHSLIKLANYNNSGGVDMLFQTETGISVIGKSTSSWSMTQIASRSYGNTIGGWSFTGNDIISPYVGDVTGDGLVDFVLTSSTALGLGYRSNSSFASKGTTTFNAIPLDNPEQVVGIGKFDRSDKYTLLYKKVGLVTPAKAAVLTYNNDNNRTGVQPMETAFTPSAITTLGLTTAYADLPIDGAIVAQVLYVPDVSIAGAALKDLAIVATATNKLYTFDAANGTAAGPTPIKTFADLGPPPITRSGPLGIKSTPVVDYDKKILYLVFGTGNGINDQYAQSDAAYWLVAWDLQSQTVIRYSKIAGSYPKSDGTAEPFLATNHYQRPALLLQKGSLYVAFGAFAGAHGEDLLSYHGWVFRYDAETFEQQGVFNSTPNEGPPLDGVGATGGGIWQGGGGVTADDAGNIYVMTGNGSSDKAGPTPLYSYADSMIRLSARGKSLQFRGRFSADDANDTLQKTDWDFGGAGVVALPGTATLIGGGKDGKYFVANAGGFEGAFAPVAQWFQAYTNVYDMSWRQHASDALGPHIHGQPIFWNNYIYHQAELDMLKAFAYNPSAGTLSTTPVLSSDGRFSPWGGYMWGREALSVNGIDTTTGVLWARQQLRDPDATGCEGSRWDHRPAVERIAAYRAVPQGGVLQCLKSMILPGIQSGVPPTIAGGKVFVPANTVPYPLTPQGFIIRVFKLGTGASGFDDCANYTPPPLNCMGLVFQGHDAQAYTTTPDWAPGKYKAECAFGQGGIGLSIETATLKARALYCGKDSTSYFAPRSTCHAVDFSTPNAWYSWDWDPWYYKGECSSGEYVAGIAQNTSGALTHLLCCTGTALAKTSCETLTMTGSNVTEPNHPGVDYNQWPWDPYNQVTTASGMAQCGPGRYIAGVSRDATYGCGHMIYCCTH